MKIAELIEEYDKIAKKRSYNTATKTAAAKVAFVPNPNVPPPQPGQPVQAALPPGQADPATQQQQAAQGQPPQGGGGQPGQDPMMDQLMTVVQQLPPEVQQQLGPVIQQLQALPPEQRQQQIQQILQQLQGQQQQAAQGQPPQGQPPQGQPPQGQPPQGQPPQGGGMVAQAADEYMYGGAVPQEPTAAPQDPMQQAAEDADNAESSAVEAKNELDNVRVSLTVRELLDLVGKGTATASLLKVKQLADTHKQKMDQTRQKAEADQQKQMQEAQSAQQGGMMSGGIYPNPMDSGTGQ